MEIIVIVLVAFLLWIFSQISDRSPDNAGRRGESLLTMQDYVGKRGENLVATRLERGIAGEKHILNDCRFRVGSGSAQIDHIVICKGGVFAIETKNWGGWLYGDDFREKWTQVYRHGKIKSQFFNPVLQNETHAKILSHILKGECEVVPIVCLVRFGGGKIESEKVAKLDDICGKINGFPQVLTAAAIERAFSHIKNALAEISDEDHIRNISRHDKNVCPLCRGNLVLRRGKWGEFYGCQNYPRCKFTKN